MSALPGIRRAFADLADRHVHYRHAGNGGMPLVMLHASPASSRQLEPLIAPMARARRVIAADRPGNGDSDPLALAIPEIADYASAELELLDMLGIREFDVFGSHTGAFVAMELALLAPLRVQRVILDGIALFTAAQRDEYLASYAPAQVPDSAGLHLQWAFTFCRDQYMFFPWFRPDPAHARKLGLGPAASLHATTLDVLKSIGTYHLAYNAAFRYEPRLRLPLLRHQVLAFCATDDPLLADLHEAASFVPGARHHTVRSLREPGALAELATLLDEFLAGSTGIAPGDGHEQFALA